MRFESEYIYHIYNRSNNKTFIERANYLYFLEKINKHIKPNCEILAWCLMPNHFHFMVQANKNSVALFNKNDLLQTQRLAKSWGSVLSSYTQGYNKKYQHRGSLWAHKTTAAVINGKSNDYAISCFYYIHQNPVRGGLVVNMEDWEFSSYRDYIGQRDGNLVNKNLAYQILNYDKENFKEQSEIILCEKDLKNIW